jgi:hypothetical protein
MPATIPFPSGAVCTPFRIHAGTAGEAPVSPALYSNRDDTSQDSVAQARGTHPDPSGRPHDGEV